MDFSLMVRVLPVFVDAAMVTVEISLLSLLLGLIVASIVTAAWSRNGVLRFVGSAYVSLFRGTPALIQIFLLYFGGPQIGIQLEAFAAGTIALGLNIAAYMAESIRGAILSVDRGQNEAARRLGLARPDDAPDHTAPGAKLMIRPLGVNSVALVKGTALVSTSRWSN